MNNVSDNIYDVVNIPKNNEVHDGSAPVNEGVTEDDSFSKRYDKK